MDAVDDLAEAEHPDVKLSHRGIEPVDAADQDRTLDVFLDDPFLTSFLLKKSLYLLEAGKDSNATTSIRILTWLNNPNATGILLIFPS